MAKKTQALRPVVTQHQPNKGAPASYCCFIKRNRETAKPLCPPLLPSPLTSPGLISSRAVTCKRKLFSGKEVSALGTQLWLPRPQKTASRVCVHNQDLAHARQAFHNWPTFPAPSFESESCYVPLAILELVTLASDS